MIPYDINDTIRYQWYHTISMISYYINDTIRYQWYHTISMIPYDINALGFATSYRPATVGLWCSTQEVRSDWSFLRRLRRSSILEWRQRSWNLRFIQAAISWISSLPDVSATEDSDENPRNSLRIHNEKLKNASAWREVSMCHQLTSVVSTNDGWCARRRHQWMRLWSETT